MISPLKSPGILALLGALAIGGPWGSPPVYARGANARFADLLLLRKSEREVGGLLRRQHQLKVRVGRVPASVSGPRLGRLNRDLNAELRALAGRIMRVEAFLGTITRPALRVRFERELFALIKLQQQLSQGFGLIPITPSSPSGVVNPFGLSTAAAVQNPKLVPM